MLVLLWSKTLLDRRPQSLLYATSILLFCHKSTISIPLCLLKTRAHYRHTLTHIDAHPSSPVGHKSSLSYINSTDAEVCLVSVYSSPTLPSLLLWPLKHLSPCLAPIKCLICLNPFLLFLSFASFHYPPPPPLCCDH